MSHKQNNESNLNLASVIAQAGVDTNLNNGSVSPPIHRVSTIAFANHEALKQNNSKFRYGRDGSENCEAIKEILASLEGSTHTTLTSSGLSALTITLISNMQPNCHILVTDGVYGGLRSALPNAAKLFNATVEFYDPCCGEELEEKIRDNTAIIFAESPSTQTFEIPDLKTHIEIANKHGIPIAVDNTWSAGVFLQPLKMGANYSIQSLTKYFGGHSDILAGAVMSKNEADGNRVASFSHKMGFRLAEDEAWLTLRGSRSLLPRIKLQERSAIDLAMWLENQDEVSEVRHPALASHPQHKIWKNQFIGSSSLFAFSLSNPSEEATTKFIDNLKMFHVGFSFGGFDSLITSYDHTKIRNYNIWPQKQRGLRIYLGLDDINDIKQDISDAFKLIN